MKTRILFLTFILTCLSFTGFSQSSFKPSNKKNDVAKARSIINRAIENLGGEKYLGIKNSVGRGRFSLLKDGVISSFQSFVDVIVYPNKERTDFKESGSKTVQTNSGNTGWMYLGHLESLRDQTEREVNNFKRGMKTHYNYLLREKWTNLATLSYAGRKRASIGKRNDVVKLTFKDGLEVEFEFSDKGLPVKSRYKRFTAEKKEIIEEDRYAQFIDIEGVLVPHIIDHYTDDKQTFRANYESYKYNRKIPDSVFIKPPSAKKLKKLKKY